MRRGERGELIRSFLSITAFLIACAAVFGFVRGFSALEWLALIAIAVFSGLVLTAAQEAGRRPDSDGGGSS